MNKNKELVLELLTSLGHTPSTFADLDSDKHEIGELNINCVGYTGGEGDGAPCARIYVVNAVNMRSNNAELHFRITGTHNSWSDNCWDDDVEIVEARQVTVTEWVEV